MRVMDKMGIDLNTVEGLVKIMTTLCNDIPDNIALNKSNEHCDHGPCFECKAERLLAEVPTVSRWETIRTDGDIEKCYMEFRDYCMSRICDGTCPYRPSHAGCFGGFLLDKIEVEA